MDRFDRHIRACNNLVLPGGLIPFRVGEARVGWVSRDVADALVASSGDFRREWGGVVLAAGLSTPALRSRALARAVAHLAERGLARQRGEAFDVRATPDGPVLATLDRGALPVLGVMSQGVHVNGLVRRQEGLHVWVGWRARDKAVAPGQLDNLVAGGISAGMTAEQTLLKEGTEEACLPPELAAAAQPVGRVSYVMATKEGARRDVLHCYDLDLPESFTPRPGDDEVERFELWPAARLVEAVRDTDSVKFNVNLVLIDLFLRHGLIDLDTEAGRRLRAGLDRGVA